MEGLAGKKTVLFTFLPQYLYMSLSAFFPLLRASKMPKIRCVHINFLVYLLIGFKSKTSCLTAHSLQFIRVIMTVVVTITLPASRDTVTIETGELLWLTAFPFVLDTVFAIVGQIPRSLVRALALWT